MMRLWLWASAILGSALALAIAAPGATRARADAQRELRALHATASHAEELASLRSRLAHEITDQQGRIGTLAERVAGALADAGLASSALQGVSPESQVGAGRSGGAMRRRATITLAATLPEIGRFLDAWRAREPAWTVSSIDMAPEARGKAAPTAPGGDLPVRAVLTVESVAGGVASGSTS